MKKKKIFFFIFHLAMINFSFVQTNKHNNITEIELREFCFFFGNLDGGQILCMGDILQFGNAKISRKGLFFLSYGVNFFSYFFYCYTTQSLWLTKFETNQLMTIDKIISIIGYNLIIGYMFGCCCCCCRNTSWSTTAI